MEGFTLTGLAFPVSPTDLEGFTIQNFAWVGGPEPVGPGPMIVPGFWSDSEPITASWSDQPVTGTWGD